MDAIDEVIAGLDLPTTFGPDAAAAPIAGGDAAPPAPSASESTESEPVDAATTQNDPSPRTDAPDETPDLAAQLADLQSRLEAAEQTAQEAETARQRAEQEQQQREAAAKRQLNENLRAYAVEQVRRKLQTPEDLEPHEYQQLQQQWAQLHAQPHVERATEAEGEVERLAAYITVEKLGAAYGLAEDEKQAMASFPTPQAMEQYARSIQGANATRETELATLRQQINDLQLQVAAQGRRESGADTVGSPTGQPVTTDLDSLTGDAYMDAWFTQTFPARQGSPPGTTPAR